jgi:predicted AlkP superfamily pyrophosphatase or phosphodiesterase
METTACRRVLLVVLDGLRPDAIDAFQLENVRALQAQGAWTHQARTIWPPVTAAAMGSLLTGVHPPEHGLTSDRFHIPRSRAGVQPLPALLRDAGFITSAFLSQPPLLFRRLARALAERLGVDRPTFTARSAAHICSAAVRTLARQQTGLILVHLPDADDAGHQHGWMSNEYRDAARRLDAALGTLMELALPSPETLMVVCADHGGGGVVANDHESDHPLDRTIPIILAGAGVEPGAALHNALIVDIPPTILVALGLAQPTSYAGRALHEAFQRELVAA